MSSDSEAQQHMQELQMLEHNMNSILTQKQAFQLDLNESLNALEEVKKTSGDVYKVLGGVMLKTDKKKAASELEEKKKLIEMRLEALEKQEKLLEKRAEELRKETHKAFEKQKDSE